MSLVWHLDGRVGQIGQPVVEKAIHQRRTVLLFIGGQFPAFRNIVPVPKACPATGGRRVLSVEYGVPYERRLTPVPSRLRGSQILGKSVSCRLLEQNATFALRVPNSLLI